VIRRYALVFSQTSGKSFSANATTKQIPHC
jgi:hypothetical protein